MGMKLQNNTSFDYSTGPYNAVFFKVPFVKKNLSQKMHMAEIGEMFALEDQHKKFSRLLSLSCLVSSRQ